MTNDTAATTATTQTKHDAEEAGHAAAAAFAQSLATNPEALLQAWKSLASLIILEAAFPEALEVTVDDDGETYPALRCPYAACGAIISEEGGVQAIDWTTTATGSDRVDLDERAVYMHYDHEPHMEGLHYACEACDRPIAMPAGYTEEN